MRDTGIADRLRAAGLNVVEVQGWQTRGSSDFTPQGSVDHHTAGPRVGNAPSLNICINGRSDLPGPLCHVLVGRDNTCWVIAAGRANHAGSGGWRGLSGNSSVYGVERENVGTTAEPWRPDQTETAAKVHAALIKGRSGADLVCLHKEWAPGRKIDPHTITGPQLRELVRTYLTKSGGEVPKEDSLSAQEVAQIKGFIDDTRPYFAKDASLPAVWIVYKDSGTKRWVASDTMWLAATADRVYGNGVGTDGKGVPWPRSKAHLDTYETVGPVPPGW